jgi:hypothetical protein
MASLADVDAYVKDPFAFVTVPVKDYAAMKAVIEAAKAWLVLAKNPDAGVYDGDLELEQAVEALQAAEGGE